MRSISLSSTLLCRSTAHGNGNPQGSRSVSSHDEAPALRCSHRPIETARRESRRIRPFSASGSARRRPGATTDPGPCIEPHIVRTGQEKTGCSGLNRAERVARRSPQERARPGAGTVSAMTGEDGDGERLNRDGGGDSIHLESIAAWKRLDEDRAATVSIPSPAILSSLDGNIARTAAADLSTGCGPGSTRTTREQRGRDLSTRAWAAPCASRAAGPPGQGPP